MKVLKIFYSELWHNMPLWLVAISILLLYPIISLNETPYIALINLVGIICVLVFTNIFMAASKRINPFKNMNGKKVKYVAATLRVITFMILSATFVTTVELICQAFFYHHYLKFGVYFPFFSVSCLVLSQYGSFATRHTIKESLINSINSGIGFGTFLLIIGSVSLFISSYWANSFLPTIIGIAGLILIIVLSKKRANPSLQ